MPKPKADKKWIQESITDVRFDEFYDLTGELGSGATSVVHKCIHKKTGKEWAVKIINKMVEKKVVRSEIGILLKLNHPNIVSCLFY